MYKKYLAIDQYGNKIFIDDYPRKSLCEYFGVKHAEKMYLDDKEGISHHVGYVVGGHWCTILRLFPLEKE